MSAVAVLAKTLWGGGGGAGPRALSGGAIISSQWKNWGPRQKMRGPRPPWPRPRTATGCQGCQVSSQYGGIFLFAAVEQSMCGHSLAVGMGSLELLFREIFQDYMENSAFWVILKYYWC